MNKLSLHENPTQLFLFAKNCHKKREHVSQVSLITIFYKQDVNNITIYLADVTLCKVSGCILTCKDRSKNLKLTLRKHLWNTRIN